MKKKLDDDTLQAAAEAELADAHGYEYNTFKIELARRAIMRAVMSATKAA